MEPDAEGVCVLLEGADVVVHRAGRTDLQQVEGMADLVLDLAALLPGFVVRDNPLLADGRTRREADRLRLNRWGL